MAPNHVEMSVLFVPIMPETSGLPDAMEQVGKDATESFGKGSSGIGDKIHDSITKSKDKLKDVFHRSGNEASEAIADGVKESSKKVEDAVEESGKRAQSKFGEAAKGWGKVLVDAVGPDTKKLLGDRLEETVGGALEGVLGENAKWAGKFSHTVADWGFDELKGKLGGVKDAADKTKAAFADFGKGDAMGGVSKLVDGIDKLGLGVKDLPEPIQGVINDLANAESTAKDFADIFKDMPGVVGKVGAAIEDLAGPLAIAAAAAEAIWNGLPGIGGGLKQILASPTTLDTSPTTLGLPGAGFTGNPSNVIPMPGASQSLPQEALPSLPPGMHYQASQGSLDPFSALLPPGVPMPNVSQPAPLAPMDMPDGSPPAPSPHPFVAVPPRANPTVPAAPASGKGLNLATIPVAAQQYANDCIDASARIILSHSGVNMTEDQMKGVIAAGGTIDSQAAGMNRLDPSGGFKAMAGSGGSAQTMFAAIKASIDGGTGSVLNVAPGSSLAGRNFADGHFIAATGYNADGTINVSDTARGTKYSVSAADAFQATRGRGIVAGSGHGPGAANGPASPMPDAFSGSSAASYGGSGGGGGGSGGGQKMPSGAQHDPLYVMPADTGSSGSSGSSGGGSDAQDLSGQLGQGLLGGIAQSVGLDGSVFKGFGGASNPMNFGITKLATGLLNHASHGAGVSQNAIPVGPGGAQTGSTGATITNHIDNSFTANGIGTPQEQKEAFNAKPPPVSSGVPGGGGFPVAGVP